jgi:hypothetical protein
MHFGLTKYRGGNFQDQQEIRYDIWRLGNTYSIYLNLLSHHIAIT